MEEEFGGENESSRSNLVRSDGKPEVMGRHRLGEVYYPVEWSEDPSDRSVAVPS